MAIFPTLKAVAWLWSAAGSLVCSGMRFSCVVFSWTLCVHFSHTGLCFRMMLCLYACELLRSSVTCLFNSTTTLSWEGTTDSAVFVFRWVSWFSGCSHSALVLKTTRSTAGSFPMRSYVCHRAVVTWPVRCMLVIRASECPLRCIHYDLEKRSLKLG